MTDSNPVWGVSTSIDLYDCDPVRIGMANAIRTFAEGLCKVLDVKPFGECQVVHFGEHPEIAGYSMVQLIETSLISGHFVDETNAAYIDIFSCKSYDIATAAAFAEEFFGAGRCLLHAPTRRYK